MTYRCPKCNYQLVTWKKNLCCRKCRKIWSREEVLGRKATTVFEAIEFQGHDDDFRPHGIPLETMSMPGSPERIEVYRARIERGEVLCVKNDYAPEE